MKDDIITSALDPDDRITRVEDATSGLRYFGATPHHKDCELYPVIRKYKRSSFAHMPRQMGHGHYGESDAHGETVKSWMRFFNTQLSGCIVCQMDGMESADHDCQTVSFSGGTLPSPRAVSRFFGEIIWTCHECLRVHKWDLLDGAVRVTSNRRVPGLSSRVRPDITILGDDDRILALLEFRKSHLSDEARRIACEHDIPLFIVDVEGSPSEFQAGLNNPKRDMWELLEPSEENRRMGEAAFRFRESVAEDGGLAAEFSVLPDANGDITDILFHATGKSSALPQPSLATYLVASESSLTCESQKRWMLPDGSQS